jgi:hypothetical protein
VWAVSEGLRTRKRAQPTKITALSIFACNSSLIAGTNAEDDYKDNDEVEDVMKFRDSLLGRQAVAGSPLAWFTSALQRVSFNTCAM